MGSSIPQGDAAAVLVNVPQLAARPQITHLPSQPSAMHLWDGTKELHAACQQSTVAKQNDGCRCWLLLGSSDRQLQQQGAVQKRCSTTDAITDGAH